MAESKWKHSGVRVVHANEGRSTSVWQTRVTDESGKLLSLTNQTQTVLQK
jgi:acyl-coenzyme A thioesterase PaaI-like protein